jgi:hypothetical protein
MAYDAHASHFQQIVKDGEQVMTLRGSHFTQNSTSSAPYTGFSGLAPHLLSRFTTGPGIIQPLLLTASKYRASRWRYRAIAVLSLAGREGPWVGPREAAVAHRIMELEEGSRARFADDGIYETSSRPGLGKHARIPLTLASSPGFVGHSNPTGTLLTSLAVDIVRHGSELRTPDFPRAHVPVPAPIYSTSIFPDDPHSTSTPNSRCTPNKIVAKFSRSRDIDAMLACPRDHGLQGGTSPREQCEVEEHWEMWAEVLDF